MGGLQGLFDNVKDELTEAQLDKLSDMVNKLDWELRSIGLGAARS
jgi:hypothetical protein